MEAWPAIADGRNSLLLAPTGSGKTLAAFLASIDRLFFDGEVGKTIGPIAGPESWMICRINGRTPPRRQINVKVERERELVLEDYITYRFLEWANEVIAKAKFE